jgi:hypothetical protein
LRQLRLTCMCEPWFAARDIFVRKLKNEPLVQTHNFASRIGVHISNTEAECRF